MGEHPNLEQVFQFVCRQGAEAPVAGAGGLLNLLLKLRLLAGQRPLPRPVPHIHSGKNSFNFPLGENVLQRWQFLLKIEIQKTLLQYKLTIQVFRVYIVF